MDAVLEWLTSDILVLALRVTPVLVGAIRVAPLRVAVSRVAMGLRIGTSVTVAMTVALGIDVHASQPGSKRVDVFGAAGHRKRGVASLIVIREYVP